jgi:putative nucleotidyltransferase with HDIG domain
MAAQSARRTPTSQVAIAVGDPVQRAHVVRCLALVYPLADYSNVSEAVAGCRGHPPRLILVGEQLSPSSGFDFVRMLRLDRDLATVPVLVLVTVDNKMTRDSVAQCGADGFLAPPFSTGSLISSISGLVNRGVERQWNALQPLQRQALTDTLKLFNGISSGIGEGRAIPYQAISDACKPLVDVVRNDDFRDMLQGVREHDNYTYAHSMRVATYLTLFGYRLGLPKDEQLLLASGGLLHDVGKMTIPYQILNKPGKLTKAERAVMEGHVSASVAYLERCDDLPKGILTIAGQHHEKIDGSGYPYRLAGNKLNRLARMASIIDVFGALTDWRVYKPAIEPEAALDMMASEMASHLDMKLLGLFRQMLLDATQGTPRHDARSA